MPPVLASIVATAGALLLNVGTPSWPLAATLRVVLPPAIAPTGVVTTGVAVASATVTAALLATAAA